MEIRDIYGKITIIPGEETVKRREWTLGKYLTAIGQTKEELFKDKTNDVLEKEYKPYIINMYLSFAAETILFANEMNGYPFLDKDIQFEFYRNILRKSNRRTKWIKRDNDENLKVIMEYYHYNINKAREVLNILSEEDIKFLRKKISKGGFKR